MDNSVIIKGNRYGIVVVLDEETDFEELKQNVAEKFQSASRFFDKANMAVTFEGRVLDNKQQQELITTITNNSEINIVCVMENDSSKEADFQKAIDRKKTARDVKTANFYKGTLRSGQVVESESSIIIVGDVNPGANVYAKGSVIILGSLRGTVYAGTDGNDEAFVIAMEMAPIQIRIGDVIARSNDHQSMAKPANEGPRAAFVEDGNIYIEKLSKETLDGLQI